MIRLVNQNEVLVEWSIPPVVAANNPTANTNALTGYAPTASKILDVFSMPFEGFVLAWIGVIGTVGAAGNSVDLKSAYRVRNGGYDLAGTTILTADALAIDLTQSPTLIPVAGTKIISPALSGQAPIPIGSKIHLHYNESGTVGTATRPIVTPVGFVLRAASNIDPRNFTNVAP